MKALCLRGRVGDVERTFRLEGGPLSVGSLPENDIVLPVRGVSRQHATIRIDGGEIVIEDVGSKNGIRVNGVREERSALKVGDAVALGPVTLTVEDVEGDDVDLAIDFGPAPELTASLAELETTATAERAPSRTADWVALLRDVVERTGTDGRSGHAGALEAIVSALPVSSAFLLEWSGDGSDALIVSARGALVSRDVEEAGRRLLGLASGGDDGPAGAVFESDPPLAAAAALAPGGQRYGLLLIGDYPGRRESSALLELLVRLLAPPAARGRAQRDPSPEGLVFPDGYVVGASAAMRRLHAEMASLGTGDLPVLILGETGVGKELVARTLHLSSTRRDGPFVAVNCAAIPTEMLEAELFGIGKGVATGVSERAGRFRLAQGGTLFLDEIGEMPIGLQAKLLRALQEKEIQPVGGAPQPVDLRVVTATNVDLDERMDDGRFRRDLFYRIAGCRITVPPLRERRDDILALVESMLNGWSEQSGRHVRGVTVDAARRLADYAWPGNVRELQHEVRRLVYQCPQGAAIDSGMLSPALAASPGPPAARATGGDSLDLDANVRRLEESLIRAALERAGGNRSEAARLLGISRNGLALKLKRLGLEP